ncbi:hypothetical protein CBE01nite_09130 [Clostridium beijerinckii]|uniref:Cell wall binding repeat-containing protein n=1 Tax=Clostridium beijerinckii TaxID=1520 RepID=A0AB74VI97_CLOBE|nr:hypothetical protein [Clostridium beijerinckii]NRZ25379.1 glucan-binding YG repeat protein [Clostridium beijerinckii]NYB97895.1 glucan-binding YG repeat protein [Clostridium beijerinckii]OOM25877.1 hypothetical protein CLBEI_13940 [Clostridium beijerinckii]QUN36146.1 hypothetical protein KEC93_04815 [Clostridium beijerinckii]SQB13154.1 teichoic acid phosphorylcholine esterase [Clostridium beijerinckii]
MITNKWIKFKSYAYGKEKSYWYYFGDDGKKLKNTVTPDGFKVDSDGKWIQY